MSLEEFQYDGNLGVYFCGSEMVPPELQFKDMKLNEYLLDVIENHPYLEYRKPSSVQKTAIPAILKGRNVLAASPTGSGKTVSYAKLYNTYLNPD